ncbi:uncharacterized protein LOC131662920 isoform X1 [Phymastichus coffea]|uniref:uncharacterized protein LOC131662920 isoform X1 n=1 Tax=Phymastichus coffea TaxID=108790 RepID=UPI00273C345A|nr:uncharacterized protein LOC131662920 isoform X1 [Phymastichus coffea]XP_058788913.1 uncharacterized protein LOC131662920 isoform X1 [Phymastichus coffea]XP_058788922.1 uncharacterized protein LOC131662920 isoform X1 [Phymastichus coffea]
MSSPRKKRLNIGQARYAYQQQRLGHYWRQVYQNNPFNSYSEFLRSPYAKVIRKRAVQEFNEGIAHSEQTLPEISEADLVNLSNLSLPDEAGPSSPSRARSDRGPVDVDRSPEPQPGPSSSRDSPFEGNILADSIDNINDILMADIQGNTFRAKGQSNTAVSQGGGNDAMETDAGPSSGSGVDGTSNAGGMSSIPPVPRDRSIMLKFQKRIYRYTYGVKHHMMSANKDATYVKAIATPYAYYPVDWLPWYLTKAEYLSLPENTKIIHVTSKITLLGTRTAFDHGTSLTGVATTEYIPIVKFGIGLNRDFYIQNKQFTFNGTEAMQPTGYKTTPLANNITAIYGSTPPAVECPRHINWYMMYLYNETKDAGSPNDTYSITGWYRVDKKLQTVMVNHVIGKPIVNYSYSPRSGYVKPSKRALCINMTNANGFPTTFNYIPYNHTMPTFMNVTKDKDSGAHILNSAASSFTKKLSTRVDGDYGQSLETYVNVHAQTGSVSTFIPQPQVHLGLLATPSLKPDKENSEFLNSSVYTLSENEIILEFNMDSFCNDATYHWPEEVRFFMDRKHDWVGEGYQTFGMQATLEGQYSSSGTFEVQDINEQLAYELQRTSVSTASRKKKKSVRTSEENFELL